MTCMKQEFCIHEKYCQRHIGQNFDSCILFSRNSKPMTNEEWLRSATTEQLAEWIYHERYVWSDGWYEQNGFTVNDVVDFLKQPHNGG